MLLGEFRKDLKGDPPASLNMVSQPATKQLELVLEVAKSVRETHATYYVKMADDIQQELHLDSLGIAPEKLGTIDTFRFEEQVLLEHVGNLIVGDHAGIAKQLDSLIAKYSQEQARAARRV